MPARINKIIDAVANNEIKVSVDAIDEKTLVVGLQKVANRITVGLIIAALIVGAALLMRVETTFRIWGYPGLAILFFLAAAGGGMALLINIVFYEKRRSKVNASSEPGALWATRGWQPCCTRVSHRTEKNSGYRRMRRLRLDDRRDDVFASPVSIPRRSLLFRIPYRK